MHRSCDLVHMSVVDGHIGILQISFRKLDIYGFYVAYDGIWDVINDRQSHFG